MYYTQKFVPHPLFEANVSSQHAFYEINIYFNDFSLFIFKI